MNGDGEAENDNDDEADGGGDRNSDNDGEADGEGEGYAAVGRLCPRPRPSAANIASCSSLVVPNAAGVSAML